MKPFNLQKALEGAPVATRDGCKVSGIKVDNTYPPYCILGWVHDEKEPTQAGWTNEGLFFAGGENDWDLFMADTQPPDYAIPAGPLTEQVGGNHYKQLAIQPVEFIEKNKLSFLEGCVIKRICRHRNKNKAEDLKKAIHEIRLLLQLEYGETETKEGK